MADNRFGRIVLQTPTSGAYTLDLYEAEGIICRGFYLPPPPPLGSPLPAGIPSEVEFAAPADVWDLLVESLFGGEVSDALVRHYALADPRVSNSRFYVDMAAAPGAERLEAEVWTGHVRAGLGEFTFVLEQYGSPEIAAVLIIICILLFSDQHASEHAAECARRAVETCGEGRIRSVHVARRLTGTTLRVETECQFECVEHGSLGG